MIKTYAWSLLKPFGFQENEIESLRPTIISIDTFFKLEEILRNKNYEEGYNLISDYFDTFNNQFVYLDYNRGPNFGTPVCLYSLLMFKQIFTFYKEIHNKSTIQTVPYIWTIVMVGKSHGIYPDSLKNVENQKGKLINNVLNPEILKDDYRILRDCFFIFCEYLKAISKGILTVNLNFLYLDYVDVECVVNKQGDTYFNTIKDYNDITKNISEEIINLTNAWLYIYPSHKNYDDPLYKNNRFVSGGCAMTIKPILMSDDLFLFRKINDLGFGYYSNEERRAYIPQWIKHEYFHYLFNVAFPEFKLEQKGHDWFNRSFWPKDFEGDSEPVFYDQALTKRFLKSDITIWIKLSGKMIDLSKVITKNNLCGRYELLNVTNDWHIVKIYQQKSFFTWTNKSNVSWKLIPSFNNGKLLLDQDCPYINNCKDVLIFPVFKNGMITENIDYLQFNGEN